jgi:Family of unknown function (DUF6496)
VSRCTTSEARRQRTGRETAMTETKTVEQAKEDIEEGKSPSTAAGEFVREEMHHIREGKHGARSTKQAIAIGLSKARRAGVPLKPPSKGRTSERTHETAQRPMRPVRLSQRGLRPSLRCQPSSGWAGGQRAYDIKSACLNVPTNLQALAGGYRIRDDANV